MKKQHINIVFGLNYLFFYLSSFVIYLKPITFNDDILTFLTYLFNIFNNYFISFFSVSGYYIFIFLSILTSFYFIFLPKQVFKIFNCLVINFVIFSFLFILFLNFISFFNFTNNNYINGLISNIILLNLVKIKIWFRILLFFFIFLCFCLFILTTFFLCKKKCTNYNSQNDKFAVNENLDGNNELQEIHSFKDLIEL